eukprot:g2801.t1
MELMKAEQSRIQMQRQMDLLQTQRLVEQKFEQEKKEAAMQQQIRDLAKDLAVMKSQQQESQFQLRLERKERQALEGRIAAEMQRAAMQQQIRELTHRLNAASTQHTVPLDLRPAAHRTDGLPRSILPPRTDEFGGTFVNSVDQQRQQQRHQLAAKEAAIADMQRQLLADQQQAERWRREAAEKEVAIARQKADMELELELRAKLSKEAEHTEALLHAEATSRNAQEKPAVKLPAPFPEPSQPARGGSGVKVRLPIGARNHFFISHSQATGGDQANTLYLEFERLGFSCWYDNRASDLTKDGMRQGIIDSEAFILFLSPGILCRPFEIRVAIAQKKTMILIRELSAGAHESDARHGAYDFYAEQMAAPEDLKHLTDKYESLAFRRRGYERDALLWSVIEVAGFKELIDKDTAGAGEQQQLATLPKALSHFETERVHDRPVQREIVALLLLPKSAADFASIVLVHGMGGTGKTVTAVVVLQEAAVRAHFSEIYWLTVGADAVGEKVKQLQALLYKQVTGANMKGEEESDAHARLGMLVQAMAQKPRALLVLDDPWVPEQVRFLNPIDGSQTEHRLLLTTRIRELVPRATRVELPLMGQDEAVALLLDLASIKKDSYLKEHSGAAWPPQAAYTIAAECGLLPITLTIAAQVVRSWGDGWDDGSASAS